MTRVTQRLQLTEEELVDVTIVRLDVVRHYGRSWDPAGQAHGTELEFRKLQAPAPKPMARRVELVPAARIVVRHAANAPMRGEHPGDVGYPARSWMLSIEAPETRIPAHTRAPKNAPHIERARFSGLSLAEQKLVVNRDVRTCIATFPITQDLEVRSCRCVRAQRAHCARACRAGRARAPSRFARRRGRCGLETGPR